MFNLSNLTFLKLLWTQTSVFIGFFSLLAKKKKKKGYYALLHTPPNTHSKWEKMIKNPVPGASMRQRDNSMPFSEVSSGSTLNPAAG